MKWESFDCNYIDGRIVIYSELTIGLCKTPVVSVWALASKLLQGIAFVKVQTRARAGVSCFRCGGGLVLEEQVAILVDAEAI